MRLHSAPRSGNSYKVRLLLGLLATRCEIVNYDTKGGQTHAPGFLENVNPDGKVPVLELEDGAMLPESGAILYYLAEALPTSRGDAGAGAGVALDVLRAVQSPAQPLPAPPVAHVGRRDDGPKKGPSLSNSWSRVTGPSG